VARRREVEVGFSDDDNSEILSGIADGDLVVVQGQRALRDGQPVKLLEPLELDSQAAERASDVAGAQRSG
jgi:multidrug efflux pump subunit AcrA (membrane-fusion protein)